MILLSSVFLIWCFLLWIFSRYNMHFYKFILGSVGSFVFLMYIGQNIFQGLLQYAVTYATGLIGNVLNMYKTYPEYSMIIVYYKAEAISFFVDFECSGIIEMLVFVCLLLFYPIYSAREKAGLIPLGVIYIFLANVFRVFVICGILKVFGSSIIFFTHTVFARVLFFFMMIILYYYVFTRPHILRQKVGNLSYGK